VIVDNEGAVRPFGRQIWLSSDRRAVVGIRQVTEAISMTITGIMSSAVLAILLCLPSQAPGSDGGWGYVIEKLVADGVERKQVDRAYARLPRFSRVGFSIDPVESGAMYRKLRSERSVSAARACRARHDEWLDATEARSGVSASVVSALLHVETSCGAYTGRSIVLHRLSRLAMANEPANLRYNIERWTAGEPATRRNEIALRVRERGRYLEETFYPEVLATFELAKKLDIDPLGIRGSESGAFGLPQFLPSSYLRFGVDGNGNGRVSMYEPADAIASAANYLVAHGWRPDLTRADKRRVLWAYNRSEAYIDTVLTLTDRIEESHPSIIVQAAASPAPSDADGAPLAPTE
jgi:membrane-bound lytic murein transglycosylase B